MVGTFASSGGTVMAVSAGIRGLTVIERCQHWNPHAGVVTGLAQVCRQRMVGGFKCARADAIMTAGTGARLPRYGGVIKSTDQPGSGGMATVARCGSHHMIGPFTRGGVTVVTISAGVGSLVVIERCQHRSPYVGIVTGLA